MKIYSIIYFYLMSSFSDFIFYVHNELDGKYTLESIFQRFNPLRESIIDLLNFVKHCIKNDNFCGLREMLEFFFIRNPNEFVFIDKYIDFLIN